MYKKIVDSVNPTSKIENKVIEGYEIIDNLGKGAFGFVYTVAKGDKKYALKEINYTQLVNSNMNAQDKKSITQISKEIEAYKLMDHPSIVKYENSFVKEESVYIVMELAEGKALSEYINSCNDKVCMLTRNAPSKKKIYGPYLCNYAQHYITYTVKSI